MNIVRSMLAVTAGYIVFSVLSILTAIAALFLLGQGQPQSFTFKFISSACITILAGIAGYVTAVVARKAELFHALALGVILLLSAVQTVISVSGGGGELLISGVLQFIGAVAGGYLRARFTSPKQS